MPDGQGGSINLFDPNFMGNADGGGRFLDAPLPKDGITTLDFNKAYNPYCSVNDNVMCPVVPTTSRLGVRVVAGEKYVRSD
jgi:uncharacterized protein (DUF1684 family)